MDFKQNAEYLAGYEQQDAHEFLMAALHMIHEKLAPKTQKQEVKEPIDLEDYCIKPKSIIDQVNIPIYTFRGKITKMVTRMNSWILTNSPYI